MLALCGRAEAQGSIAPVAHQVFLTNAGAPLVNGKICTYAAGTSTAQATYSDEALTTELPNPIRTNSAGRMQNGSGTETNVYWLQASYKVVILTAGSDNTCSTGTTIYSADHVPAIPAIAAATDIEGTAGETLLSGDAVYLSAADGKWYKTDADATATSTTAGTVGVVPANIASGSEGSIRLQGRITGLSALSAGEKYYISATAGAITATPPTNARYIAQADSTTSIVVGGNPSLCLPDSNGSHDLCIKTTSDLTADRLLTWVPGDAARTVTLGGNITTSANVTTTGAGNLTIAAGAVDRTITLTDNVSLPQATPTLPLNIMEGRLTLTTATPVTTADVTAATTLYWALYTGNRITLYTGSAWTVVTFSQLSITMVGLTASKPYDVFIDYAAGTPALEVVVWTNDTTRATALATQDGVYVQTGDADSRYVGTIYIDAGGGAVTDSFALRHVWNYYNRVDREMRVLEATNSWTAGTSWGQANSSAANQLDTVIGVAEDGWSITVVTDCSADTAGDEMRVAIGLDSTSAPATGAIFHEVQAQATPGSRLGLTASLRTIPAAGRHIAVWLESGTATMTCVGDNGGTNVQSGINGWMRM